MTTAKIIPCRWCGRPFPDRYPIGQRLFMHNERLTEMIVRNLHQRILENRQQAA